MVKLEFIKLGKAAFDEYTSLAEVYLKRLSPLISAQDHILKNDKLSPSVQRLVTDSPGQPKRAHLVCLDQKGKSLSSEQWAERLQTWLEAPKPVAIVIGGAYGIPPSLLDLADETISLAPVTLTSDMAWLLCHEQVYRAMTIAKNIPYHH